ncbi:MAG: WXG100 family type VII secretion target [Erysipelotrichaceae bacterium]|nr:WXG100 family type VII secretion target [Erysipelotrichaceae bacterium]
MRSIAVEPERLEACASRMEQETDDYTAAFMRLFEAVDRMKAGWEGKDNAAFTNQIRKFEGDFRQMSVLCMEYAEFLRNSARAYREMQDDLTSQASALSVG